MREAKELEPPVDPDDVRVVLADVALRIVVGVEIDNPRVDV